MRKYGIIYFIILWTAFLLVGGSSSNINYAVAYKEIYSEIIGFDENNDLLKPIPQDTMLILKNENYQKFVNEYFVPREIPIPEPDKEKAVLYLQMPSEDSSVDTYTVKGISVKENNLVIDIEKEGMAQVDAVSEFKGMFKWVEFIEIDKQKLSDNMKIKVNKSNQADGHSEITENPINSEDKSSVENINTKPKSPAEVPQKILDYIVSMEKKNSGNVAEEVNKWANYGDFEKNGFIANCAKAEKTDTSLPDVYLLNYSMNQGGSEGYIVYWRDGDNFKYQSFPIDNDSENGFADSMTVISARIAKGNNDSIEMGAIFDSMGYGNGGWEVPRPIYKLLRLKNAKWELLWSSPKVEQPDAKWQNNRGTLKFTKNDISEFVLQGDSLFYTDGKERILAQTKSGRLRYIQQTWVKNGDQYILKSSEIAPSTYNTLIEFIYTLSKGDDNTATKYVANRELINKAKELNMLQKSLDKEWWIIYPADIFDREEMNKQSPLVIAIDPENGFGIKVDFINDGEKFTISGIDKCKY